MGSLPVALGPLSRGALDREPFGLDVSPGARAQLQVHFCVVLWGFTGILGKLISLPAFALVWWRMVLVTGGFLLYPPVWRAFRVLSPRLRMTYGGIGCLVALHWVTFYASIKLANASVGATCMALTPVFLALVEPRIAARRFDLREVGLGLAVVPGVALVVGGIPLHMRAGLAMGVLSAFFVALFAACNKRVVHLTDPLTMSAVEIGAGALLLTIAAPFVGWAQHQSTPLPLPSASDAVFLAALAFACTLLPYALFLVALRHLRAFTGQLIVNLEPVYTILLAVLFFGEQRELGVSFYAGVAIVLVAVFAHPLWVGKVTIRPSAASTTPRC